MIEIQQFDHKQVTYGNFKDPKNEVDQESEVKFIYTFVICLFM
jgi:hypothetical protein